MTFVKTHRWAIAAGVAIALFLGIAVSESWGRSWNGWWREYSDSEIEIPFDEAELFFELNDTDGDLGIHSSIDGEAWTELEIEAPNGRELLEIELQSRLKRQGLTQIEFESAEPTFDELDPETFFHRFPPGEYEIEGETHEGDELESVAILTHLLPAPPANVHVQGQASAEDCDAEELPVVDGEEPVVISWDAVTHSHPELGETNEPIEVVQYQVVVEREEPTELVFSVELPPSITEIEIPASFIALSDEFKFEILVREASGNQTAVESCFEVESDSEFEPCFPTTEDLELCDPEEATFTLDSTNPYYPLVVGSVVVLEGEEDGDVIRVERRTLPESMVVDGVTTHILEHTEFINGEIHEIARNYYVEASDGTVCYFGEDVEFYEDGELVSTGGTWRAGVNGAKPGIIMPADPAVGQAYFQEDDPENARDMARVTMTGTTMTVGEFTFDNVVQIMDANPIDDEDPCEDEEKLYAPGIGEIKDVDLELVEFDIP